jgi:hypothetical protein
MERKRIVRFIGAAGALAVVVCAIAGCLSMNAAQARPQQVTAYEMAVMPPANILAGKKAVVFDLALADKALPKKATGTSGGGIYAVNGTFTMEGGAISGNKSALSGGGVYMGGGDFAMKNGTISGNSAPNEGGGVYVAGGSFIKNGGGMIDATNTAETGNVAYINLYINNESFVGKRDSAAGPEVNLDSGKAGNAGGWEGSK